LFFKFPCEECLGVAKFEFFVLIDHSGLKLTHQRFGVQAR
jgi:hypothetical protein